MSTAIFGGFFVIIKTMRRETLKIFFAAVLVFAGAFLFAAANAQAAGGCLDGTTEQDFGLTTDGKMIHGCNGLKPYSTAGSLCASGWHLGDVILDTGFAAKLSSTASNAPGRWIAMNGDPGNLMGFNDVDPDDYCWGSPNHPACTVNAADAGLSDFRPVHSSVSARNTYRNGNLITSSFAQGTVKSLNEGAICIQNLVPPLTLTLTGRPGLEKGATTDPITISANEDVDFSFDYGGLAAGTPIKLELDCIDTGNNVFNFSAEGDPDTFLDPHFFNNFCGEFYTSAGTVTAKGKLTQGIKSVTDTLTINIIGAPVTCFFAGDDYDVGDTRTQTCGTGDCTGTHTLTCLSSGDWSVPSDCSSSGQLCTIGGDDGVCSDIGLCEISGPPPECTADLDCATSIRECPEGDKFCANKCDLSTNTCVSCTPPACAPAAVECPGGLVTCGRQCDDTSTEPDETLPCGFCHFFGLFKNVLDWIIFAIAPILGILLIVIGGFLILTSRGSPAQLTQGKDFIKWTLLGFAIMLISWVLINSIFSVLQLQEWTGLQVGNWWKVSCNTGGPLPSFTVSPNTGGPPLVASFTNNSTGDITTWLWDFGDGTTSSVKDPPDHTYAEPGTYIATLKVEGPGGRASVSRTVIVVGITFDDDLDFGRGDKSDVTEGGDQLQLVSIGESLPYIWVAVSSKGTIVKISTETGEVLGEYRTAPQTVTVCNVGESTPPNPSRTTVDNALNVWVANRIDCKFVTAGQLGVDGDGKPVPQTAKKMGSVTYVGLKEADQCEDRNGIPGIQTSSGLGDVRDWDSTLTGADDFGGVSKAEDECILYYTRVNSPGTRHVSVNSDNDVWVGGITTREFDLIDDKTGKIIRQEPSAGAGGYGGLIDANDVLWSTSPHNMLRWGTSLPLVPSNFTVLDQPGAEYGTCIDSFGNVWTTTAYENTIYKYAPSGTLLGSFLESVPANGSPTAQGCAVGKNDDVWIAHSWNDGRTVGHLKNDGTWVGSVDLGEEASPTGVAVDGNGNVWATGYTTQRVYRINPALGPIGGVGTPIGAVDLTTLALGGNIYNYSDMTGSTLTAPPLTGIWSVVYDSGVPGLEWGTITWTSIEPGDSSITVKASSSDDCASFSDEETVTSGTDLTVPNGKCLKVRVIFNRSSTDLDGDGINDSPILTSLKINAT